jgi:hypothetical protein
MRHLQSRSGKILAIHVGDYVKQEHIGQQAPGNSTPGTAGNIIGANGSGNHISAQNSAGGTPVEQGLPETCGPNLHFPS